MVIQAVTSHDMPRGLPAPICSQHTYKESYHMLVSGRFELSPFLQDQTMIGKHIVLVLHSLLVLGVFGV